MTVSWGWEAVAWSRVSQGLQRRDLEVMKAKLLPGQQTVVTAVTVSPGQTPAFVMEKSCQVLQDVFLEGPWVQNQLPWDTWPLLSACCVQVGQAV